MSECIKRVFTVNAENAQKAIGVDGVPRLGESYVVTNLNAHAYRPGIFNVCVSLEAEQEGERMSKCESCGIDWTEHLGITGTCKRVQDQAAEIERLKAEIERLNNIGRNLWAGWPEALHPGITESLHGHKCHHPIMILCKTCGTGRCPAAGDERMKCTGRNEPG